MHCPLPSLESPSFGVKMGKHGGSVEQDEPQVSPDRNVSLLTCVMMMMMVVMVMVMMVMMLAWRARISMGATADYLRIKGNSATRETPLQGSDHHRHHHQLFSPPPESGRCHGPATDPIA